MANIKTLYGSDKLREAYPKINENFNELNGDINVLRTRVNTIITTPIDGEAAAQELVDARDGEVTLGKRLDRDKQIVESHLADYASHVADYASHKADYTSHKADYTSHKADYASHKADYASHKADYASHKADMAAHGGTYHKNILHNWDFRNPVNQRGQSSYSGAGYTVDGWTLNSQVLNLKEGYVELRRTLVTGAPTLSQYIENYGSYADETLTFSAEVKVTAGKTVTVLIMDGVNTYSRSYSPGASEWNIITVSGKISAAPSQLRCAIQIASASAAVGDVVWVRRAKLELGSVSTLANDPPADYGEQLALCQRYALNTGNETQIRASGYTTNTIIFSLPIPVTMRVNPSLESGTVEVVTPAGSPQSGFTFGYFARSGVLSIVATKTSHGLTDATLKATNAVFSSDL